MGIVLSEELTFPLAVIKMTGLGEGNQSVGIGPHLEIRGNIFSPWAEKELELDLEAIV